MPEFWINMGPQHPMTHGLWNMKVQVDGETVTDAKPEIGYLHRGYEKIMEVREFQKNVVLTDRLCYVSSITWSHAYCLAVEKMMGIETPERGQWIRVVALELQRIASHLMWLAAYGPDLGLLTGLLWALRERELFLDLIQLMSADVRRADEPELSAGRRGPQRPAGELRGDVPAEHRALPREGGQRVPAGLPGVEGLPHAHGRGREDFRRGRDQLGRHRSEPARLRRERRPAPP
ncbi:MAG: hypothetical protein E6J93_08710 [Methanobacteriota archaeon]|nr:MAG: hypothetical protein E6J93_08710 [Euryarchaeota archaeon]